MDKGPTRDECFWKDPGYESSLPLSTNIQTEYLIVGGGISGLATAYFLLQEGARDIVVIEKETIGSGSTGRSAGMIVCEPETANWPDLEKRFGTGLTAAYHAEEIRAFTTVKEIIKSGDIDCDFGENEILYVAGNSLGCSHILSDFATRKRMGVSAHMMKRPELAEEFSSPAFSLGENLGKGISVNPLKLIHGFAHYLRKQGVRIYEHTPLLYAEAGKAQTPQGAISYGTVVFAVGTAEAVSSVQNWATTIAVTAPLTESDLQAYGLADRDMFLDDEKESFHYGKITADQRLLIGYGDVKHEEDGATLPLHVPHLANIEKFLKRAFPVREIPIEYAWTGAYALSSDLLPFIHVENGSARIGGAGLWIDSIMSASYAVSRLMQKTHTLDALFSPAISLATLQEAIPNEQA